MEDARPSLGPSPQGHPRRTQRGFSREACRSARRRGSAASAQTCPQGLAASPRGRAAHGARCASRCPEHGTRGQVEQGRRRTERPALRVGHQGGPRLHRRLLRGLLGPHEGRIATESGRQPPSRPVSIPQDTGGRSAPRARALRVSVKGRARPS